MSSVPAMTADASSSPQKIRVYCTSHSLGFSTERARRIQCESSRHDLDHDFPRGEFWEYCCDCQSFIQSSFVKGGKAETECIVCDRQTSRRFVCAECHVVSYESDKPARGKSVSLIAKGSPQPVCPGCQQIPAAKLRSHSCEVIGADFLTGRDSCPFCQEAIALPLTFPLSVAEFFKDFKGEKINVKHNASEWLLTKSQAGEFVVISQNNNTHQALVLPKVTHFKAEKDFNKYKDYYDCANPTAGELIILSPAVVNSTPVGWKIVEAGKLEVKTEAAAVSAVSHAARLAATERATPTASQVTQGSVCSVCHTVAKPSHKFCKGCGARLADLQSTTTAAIAAPPLSTPAPTESLSQPLPDTDSANASTPSSETSKSSFTKEGKLIGIIVAALAVVAIAVVLSLRSSSFAVNTESKLDNAITRGNLMSPSGESAYDYYLKLKQEGASQTTLTKYNEKLLPLLTTRPQQMMDRLIHELEAPDAPLAEWEEAQRMTAWAAELRPGDKILAAKAAYCKGRVASIREQWGEALKAWMEAIKLDVKFALAYNGVGLMHNAKGEYTTSRIYLSEAIRLAPDWAAPYNNMGTSYKEQKNYYEAQNYYEQAVSRAPNWARPYAWLGDLAQRRGDYCHASQMYQKAIDLAVPGMRMWNPQKMQEAAEAAAAKCSYAG
jgi:hypothetical protein